MSKKLFFLVAGIGLAGLFSGCDDSDAVSARVLKCTPGAEKCDNGKYSICLGTDYSDINCPSNACNDDGKTCKLEEAQVCLPGVKMCDVGLKNIKSCSSDGKTWETTACPGDQQCDMKTGEVRCLPKSEVNPAECSKGDVKCSADKSKKQVCGDDQQWGNEVACGEGKTCDESKKDCVQASNPQDKCTPNTVKCSDDHKGTQTCGANEQWGGVVGCGTDKVCVDGNPATCVEDKCTPNSVKCSEDHEGTHTCGTNEKWGEKVNCGRGKVCQDGNPATCVEDKCTPNSVKCSEDHEGTHTCGTNEKWGEKVNCGQGKVCQDGDPATCVALKKCKANDVKCTDDRNGTQTCNAQGEWAAAVPCGEKKKCDVVSKTCVAEDSAKICVPNETFCKEAGKSTGLYLCSSDGMKAKLLNYCFKCNEDFTDCLPDDNKCKTGDVQCSAGYKSLETCNEQGKWESSVCPVTPKVTMCNPNLETPKCEETICTPGTDFCLFIAPDSRGNGMYHCNDYGQKGEPTGKWCKTCNADNTDCGDVAKCTPGETYCSKDYKSVNVCNQSGQWTAQLCETTPKIKMCDPNGGDGFSTAGQAGCKEIVCKPGEKVCTYKEGLKDNGIHQCTDYGQIGKILQYCEPCNDDFTDCAPKCKDGSRKCDGTDILVCQKGVYVKDKMNCTADNVVCNDELGSVCVPAITMKPKLVCDGINLLKWNKGLYEVDQKCRSFCTGPRIGDLISSGITEAAQCSDQCVGKTKTCDDGFTSFTNCNNGNPTSSPCSLTDAKKERCIEKVNSASCEPKVCDELEKACADNSGTANSSTISICYNNKWEKLVNCKDYGLACKDGRCVAMDTNPTI